MLYEPLACAILLTAYGFIPICYLLANPRLWVIAAFELFSIVPNYIRWAFWELIDQLKAQIRNSIMS